MAGVGVCRGRGSRDRLKNNRGAVVGRLGVVGGRSLACDRLAVATKYHIHGTTAFTVGPHCAFSLVIRVLSEDELGNCWATG